MDTDDMITPDFSIRKNLSSGIIIPDGSIPLHTIVIISKGKGSRIIDFKSYTFDGPCICIIPRMAIHQSIIEDYIEGYVIQFKEEFFAPTQKELLFGYLYFAIATQQLCTTLDDKKLDLFIKYMELIHLEQQNPVQQNQVFILQNLMLALFNKMESLIQFDIESNSFIKKRTTYQKFIVLAEQHFKKQFPIQFYCHQLNTNYKQLNQILKATLGTTAQEFIIQRIIIEAKRELCFLNKSIKEIAFSLGYDNPFYFSRIFKKRTGYSPEEFRKRMAK